MNMTKEKSITITFALSIILLTGCASFSRCMDNWERAIESCIEENFHDRSNHIDCVDPDKYKDYV